MKVEKSSDEQRQELITLLEVASRAQTVDELREVVIALISAQIAASNLEHWDIPTATIR